MNDYIAALLFFLPAGLANMTPVFMNRVPCINKWRTPLDFGKTWRGQTVFGANKTWRGLLFGTLVGGLSGVVIARLNVNTVVTIEPFWVGFLLGFGALAGDAVASFLKRRRGLEPGQSWFPIDQLDYIIGGLFLIYLFVQLPLWAIATIVLVYFGLHLVINFIGYRLGWRRHPI